MKTNVKFPLPTRQYMRDQRWIVRNLADLTQRYPRKWIAVHMGRVIAVANNLGQGRRRGEDRVGDVEFPVYYMDDGDILL